jgi:hypothetical protein
VSSTLLDPRVLDASSLTPRQTAAVYLPIGIEGQADAGGSAVVGTPYAVSRVDQAVSLFGATSNKLVNLLTAILNAGAGPVIALASAKATTPTIVQRQAVWQAMESDPNIRLRLTDSEVQSDIVALGDSANNANLLYNKQVAIVGMPTGTAKAGLIAAAAAFSVAAAPRSVLIGPGIFDANGVAQGGSYAAACVAAEVAKNSDPTNDLDLWNIPALTGIEIDANGLPVFRRKVVTGAAVDDFEDLLQGGVSPLQPSRVPGGVMTTHLRTAYITNSSFDNLYTRIIVDQVFLDVRDYIYDGNFLRMGNTDSTRARIKSGVEALLNQRNAWISPITQPDGSLGYGVSVTSSTNNRQVTVGYQGIVVRGISTVQVAANLTIPV